MFSIFTPTFNREGDLRNCYASLVAQTCKDFEWIIVDDGSEDGTPNLVGSWLKVAPFPVRLLTQRNGGKHRAINRVLGEDLRRFLVFLDSDDVLVEDAIERLHDIAADVPESIAGFIGNRHELRTRAPIGRALPDGLVYANGRDLREEFGIDGDTFRVYRSSVVCQGRMPEIEFEKFAPENLLFDPIDKSYVLRVIPGEYYLSEYKADGYSANIAKHRASSPRGFALSLESSAWVARRPLHVVKWTLKYQVWHRTFFGDYGGKNFRRGRVFACLLPLAGFLYRVRVPRFIFRTKKLQEECNHAGPSLPPHGT